MVPKLKVIYFARLSAIVPKPGALEIAQLLAMESEVSL